MKARIVLIVTLAVMIGCPPAQRPAGGGKVEVVASIFPLADAVGQVGGEHVQVTCLLRAGESPHEFVLSAERAETVGRARLLVMVGLGIDEWARRVASAAGGHVTVLEVAEDPQFKRIFRAQQSEDEPAATGPAPAAGSTGFRPVPPQAHAGHVHAGADPHVWLNVEYMQQFVREIADALAKLDPAHAGEYAQRAGAYISQLEALDQEYRQALAQVPHKAFVTFHAAFGHVAARYGLRQQALHNVEAADLGPEQLERVAKFIRDNDVKAIFAEPQFARDKLAALARQTGVKVGQLDPEGNPNVKGYDSYLAMMRSNLAALVEALK